MALARKSTASDLFRDKLQLNSSPFRVALREPLHLRCGTSRTSELTCDKKRPASLEGADGASGDSIVETSAVPAPSTRDLRLGSEVGR